MNIDKNTPAFPSDNFGSKAEPGMILRDWFAGMALQGFFAGRNNGQHMPCQFIADNLAPDCYRYADAMLAARKPSVEEPEWIPWNGGKCPVEINVIGSIMLRDGTRADKRILSEFHWEHGCGEGDGDIIAYRIGGGK